MLAPAKEASTLSYVPDESTEIFDDLYLGLRAAAAVGAFGVGTFGLGFTLGGLVFGKWRKA